MPLTLNRRSITAQRVRAAMILRKKIDELERRFAKTVATLPKYILARNAYGFSAREMRKIAQNLHAKAKEEIRSGRGSEFRGSIEESFIAPISTKICEPNFAVGRSVIAPAWAG